MPRTAYIVLCVAAVLNAATPAAADGGLPSAAAEAYYRLHVENEPEGVYEWPERDLVFVQVRIPRAKGMTPDSIDSAELSATRRLMHTWLAGKAARRRVDEPLPPGMDFVRATCRKHLPMLEYASGWTFTGESLNFSRENGSEHIGATVFSLSKALDSIPAAYLAPVKDEVWINGMKHLAERNYAAQGDLPFMWSIGALDCLELSRKHDGRFPDWGAEDFPSALRTFFDAAASTWHDAPSEAIGEYAALRTELFEYLTTSQTAKGFLCDARNLVKPPPISESSECFPRISACTNIQITVVTNFVETASSITNVSKTTMAKDAQHMPSMPLAGEITVKTVQTGIAEIVTTQATTVTIETHAQLRRTDTEYSGEPRFEALFLSGGCLPNTPSPRTTAGIAAEKTFYAKASMDSRENAVLGALRENPGDKVLWNLYGRLLQARGEHLGAIICFRNALRLDMQYEFALTNLADEYRSAGRKKLSVGMAMLARGLASDPWCIKKAEAVLRGN